MSEVQQTIVPCPACGVALDVSDMAPFTNVVCPQCGEETRVKTEFGPYTLVRRHAVGGMSMVFAAHDRTLDREVALKILSEEFSADERRIAAFEKEARITASFTHPNVVRVFTTGRAFGRFYIAMEMVTGGHFEHLIRERGKIPELEMLPLAIQVARGLKAARAAGLIHRDVKPGNILLDAAGSAKLVDFGLALVTHGGKARATESWATPYYVPPETIEGRAEDFRSDIYAFGATMYHALAGKPPCGEESMATDVLREAKKKVLPLAAVDASLSNATCRIVDRAMAYDPAGRYDSYDVLISDLTSALNHVISGSDEPRSATRRRAGWIVPVAAVAAVVSAVALAAWFANRRQPEPVAITPPLTAPLPPLEEVDHPAEIERGYRAARAAAEAGDFQTAEREFGALHDNPHVQEPTRSWAGVEALLAAFLDSRPEDALRRARLVREHLHTLPSSHPLAGGEWDALLEALGDFKPLAAPEARSPAATVAAAVLAGLKDWDQGLLDDAAACFKSATALKLPPDDVWVVFYQKIATDYLQDHAVLTGPLFAEPADRAECEAAIEQLNEALATLKTRGRARFNVRAWQLDLKRRVVSLAAAKAKEVSAPAPGGPAGPSLEEVLEKLAGQTTGRRFAEFTTWLKDLPGGGPGMSKESLLAVTEAAAVFLTDIGEDLAREPFAGELKLRDGGTVTRVSVGTDGSITATSAYGEERSCEWSDFPSDTLIAIHRELVKNPASETERLRRHECAIAFDWLAGDRARALAAAAKLSAASPAFKKRWEVISAGLPK